MRMLDSVTMSAVFMGHVPIINGPNLSVHK